MQGTVLIHRVQRMEDLVPCLRHMCPPQRVMPIIVLTQFNQELEAALEVAVKFSKVCSMSKLKELKWLTWVGTSSK